MIVRQESPRESPRMIRTTLVAAAATSVLLGACATRTTPDSEVSMSYVTGTVTYRERIALPPDATIRVQLVDVSRADAPSVMLGEQVFQAQGRQPPFSFSIPYDPAGIDPRMTYAVQARIEIGGALRFVSDQRYPVLTRDAGNEVDLVLKGVWSSRQ
jgi:putative lipoprotein